MKTISGKSKITLGRSSDIIQYSTEYGKRLFGTVKTHSGYVVVSSQGKEPPDHPCSSVEFVYNGYKYYEYQLVTLTERQLVLKAKAFADKIVKENHLPKF